MPPTAVPIVSNREEDSMNTEPSLSGRTIIGLIYPPPDIRISKVLYTVLKRKPYIEAIVDKTAAFVARNGVDFENKIREKEANNKRFNFLSPTDPYNAYYKQKVRDFQEGKVETSFSTPKPQLPDAVKDAVKKADFVPTKPPPPFEFCADPATINAYDLDLIRMTALFVARNGRQFLTQLMTREARNFQFDFLKPQHSNFTYFTKLVEQYTKVIIPTNTILDDLRSEKNNTKKLMEDVNYRVAWEKHQKNLRDREEKEAEKERVAYASIDWHDFVVVQTVDFQPGDTTNLPGLCTPKDVGARILLEARSDAQKQAAEAMEMDMEESDSEEEPDQQVENEVEVEQAAQPPAEEAPPPPAEFTTPLPPTRQKDLIVKDYDPKKAAHAMKRPVDKWLISPLTGERIPSDKLEEHVRYNTVDSQYKEDRERQLGERGSEEPVLAPGAEISKNLGRFAERRTDIFGVGAAGAEQTVIGRKLGEEEPQPTKQLIWDGSEETREAHTLAVQSQVTIDQQIHEIHRQHGFLPDSSKERIGAQPPVPPVSRSVSGLNATPVASRMYPPPSGAGLMPMPPGYAPAVPSPSFPPLHTSGQVIENAPPAKRQRTEEDLEPEADWLTKVTGTIDLRIQLPTNAEFNMDGSIIGLPIEITAQVSDLKQVLQDKLSMPTGKQKLIFDGFFLKDNFSLAYYNMKNQSFVILQIKERGGKNK
ncbi:surp module [Dictyocaulus viviparus]|uniref:Surp module n=1 Tax=Dictyocaulus viviparus TaxID=29172 RepID=A0A0D8XLU9_DICVI|nr:surp module [Dictyocaulus viviparus]